MTQEDHEQLGSSVQDLLASHGTAEEDEPYQLKRDEIRAALSTTNIFFEYVNMTTTDTNMSLTQKKQLMAALEALIQVCMYSAKYEKQQETMIASKMVALAAYCSEVWSDLTDRDISADCFKNDDHDYILLHVIKDYAENSLELNVPAKSIIRKVMDLIKIEDDIIKRPSLLWRWLITMREEGYNRTFAIAPRNLAMIDEFDRTCTALAFMFYNGIVSMGPSTDAFKEYAKKIHKELQKDVESHQQYVTDLKHPTLTAVAKEIIQIGLQQKHMCACILERIKMLIESYHDALYNRNGAVNQVLRWKAELLSIQDDETESIVRDASFHSITNEFPSDTMKKNVLKTLQILSKLGFRNNNSDAKWLDYCNATEEDYQRDVRPYTYTTKIPDILKQAFETAFSEYSRSEYQHRSGNNIQAKENAKPITPEAFLVQLASMVANYNSIEADFKLRKRDTLKFLRRHFKPNQFTDDVCKNTVYRIFAPTIDVTLNLKQLSKDAEWSQTVLQILKRLGLLKELKPSSSRPSKAGLSSKSSHTSSRKKSKLWKNFSLKAMAINNIGLDLLKKDPTAVEDVEMEKEKEQDPFMLKTAAYMISDHSDEREPPEQCFRRVLFMTAAFREFQKAEQTKFLDSLMLSRFTTSHDIRMKLAADPRVDYHKLSGHYLLREALQGMSDADGAAELLAYSHNELRDLESKLGQKPVRSASARLTGEAQQTLRKSLAARSKPDVTVSQLSTMLLHHDWESRKPAKTTSQLVVLERQLLSTILIRPFNYLMFELDETLDDICDVMAVTNLNKRWILVKITSKAPRRFYTRTSLLLIEPDRTDCALIFYSPKLGSPISSGKHLHLEIVVLQENEECDLENLSADIWEKAKSRGDYASRRMHCEIVVPPELATTETVRAQLPAREMLELPFMRISPAKFLVFQLSRERHKTGLFPLDVVYIFNKSQENLAYKVKSSAAKEMNCKPSTGLLSPGESVTVHIYLTARHPTDVARDQVKVSILRRGQLQGKVEDESWTTPDFEHTIRIYLAQNGPPLSDSSDEECAIDDHSMSDPTVARLKREVHKDTCLRVARAVEAEIQAGRKGMEEIVKQKLAEADQLIREIAQKPPPPLRRPPEEIVQEIADNAMKQVLAIKEEIISDIEKKAEKARARDLELTKLRAEEVMAEFSKHFHEVIAVEYERDCSKMITEMVEAAGKEIHAKLDKHEEKLTKMVRRTPSQLALLNEKIDKRLQQTHNEVTVRMEQARINIERRCDRVREKLAMLDKMVEFSEKAIAASNAALASKNTPKKRLSIVASILAPSGQALIEGARRIASINQEMPLPEPSRGKVDQLAMKNYGMNASSAASTAEGNMIGKATADAGNKITVHTTEGRGPVMYSKLGISGIKSELSERGDSSTAI